MRAMKKFKKLLCIFCICTGMGCFAVHAQKRPYTLDFAENPPFTISENGKYSGVAVAVIARLFEKSGLSFQLSPVPLARAMAEVKVKEMHCVFPAQRSQAIEADYLWVSPIFITESGLFVKPDFKNNLNALADARKLIIGSVRGSGEAEYLKALGYSVEETNSQEQNIKMLLSGRIDVWASDVLSMRHFVQKMGNQSTMPREALVFRRALGSLACNSKTSRADIAKLQSTLDSMIQDGSLQQFTTVP